MTQRSAEMLGLLARHEDPARLLAFVERLSEGYAAAFADSAALVPKGTKCRAAINARGSMRRAYLNRAFNDAATMVGLAVRTLFTDPATWSHPVVRLGAFSITTGVVCRQRANGLRRLRSRGGYVLAHAAKNEIANPQLDMLGGHDARVQRIIPSGGLGAMIVAEASAFSPDLPLWVGLWLPSPDLKRPYFRCSVDEVIAFLRGLVRSKAAPSLRGARRTVERKRPVLKTVRKRKKGPGEE